MLFAGGVAELYLPVTRSGAMRSMAEVDLVIGQLKPRQLEIVALHAMSSCPMGVDPDSSVVAPDGRLWGMKNVLVTDASVLPTNTGESAQETIMAFAHEIVRRHIAETP